jgi:hypothetical protein
MEDFCPGTLLTVRRSGSPRRPRHAPRRIVAPPADPDSCPSGRILRPSQGAGSRKGPGRPPPSDRPAGKVFGASGDTPPGRCLRPRPWSLPLGAAAPPRYLISQCPARDEQNGLAGETWVRDGRPRRQEREAETRPLGANAVTPAGSRYARPAPFGCPERRGAQRRAPRCRVRWRPIWGAGRGTKPMPAAI